MERKVELITTSDGSHSLYLPEMNETYHSSHGALTESKHIFIQAGLQHYLNTHHVDSLKILEVGFGTGLNALLALQFAIANQTALNYVTLEPFPLPASVYSKLNYPDLFKSDLSQQQFQALHKADWEQEVMLDDYFKMEKRKERLEDYQSDGDFNVVFFDAFAPSKQAELWTYDVLQKTVGKMATSAVIVTYCARGQFKRDLAALGLTVETLPGPPGKKEMVRATTK